MCPIKGYTPIREREFLNKAVTDWNVACQLAIEDEHLNQAANRFYYALYRACAEHYQYLTKTSVIGLWDDKTIYQHDVFPRQYKNQTKDHKTTRILTTFKGMRVKSDYYRASVTRRELSESTITEGREALLKIIRDVKKDVVH